ncbi:Predicted protein [Taphrina deformans PYCC 5710]|uniref:Cryptic POLO box 1 (CPB1) domain-containing protein n=1 Tax=Taphrina deformans (strain PYCC 5710 / ATCC 11124 / CBS 356.35 / IMI 108563 / JCM 9778 / NBRC 8474) TaxID=1097556 RepID=R4X8C0_TAPDE|nr:Predicted protein [Taphrina deformans PYCC 5710]|eukprot:CCG81814.1 Predicted protein [Taphrina deformans PYCC 5710]
MTRFSNHARPVEEVPMLVHNQQLVHDIVDQDEASDRKNDETTPNVLLRVSSSESEVTSDDPVTRYKFNTADLKPVSQNNKHGQVAILEDGSVSVLLKKDGRQHLVSSDGELITTTDRNGVHKSFTLEDLPARSLLAYRYASKFVTLARNKTVRIALDSDMAKCRLYQSDTFEVVLLKQQRKLSFEPNARTIKIADHDEVLWKGTLDNVAFAHRELVRQALIWWARCKEALDEPVSEVETQAADHGPIEGDRKLDPVVKFIDGLGWCEKHDEGRLWTMYFLDGLSLEVCTKTRRLYVVKSDESKEEYKLEAGLPVDIRQRLKSISRAMKHFV